MFYGFIGTYGYKIIRTIFRTRVELIMPIIVGNVVAKCCGQ